MQQFFLRWNQGQELRQALITIAIAIILADQMIAHFGAFTQDIAWPGVLDRAPAAARGRVEYSVTRLFILAIAVAVGLGLYLWLKKTRTGMVIRAGVDDRQMVSALGVNIQLTFAIAFFVGSALAGAGRGDRRIVREPRPRRGRELASLLARRRDHRRHGVAVGAAVGLAPPRARLHLRGGVPTRGATRYYSIIITFALLALVLAFRPLGLFGRPA